MSTYPLVHHLCEPQEVTSIGLEGYLELLKYVASLYFRIKQYQAYYDYFKQYFDLFSIEEISDVEQCADFVYAFVKYVQASTHLAQSDKTDFDKVAKDFNIKMTDKLAESYKPYIGLLLHGDESTPAYIELADSSDPFDNEKYQIFMQYFVEE